jgi:hypothetical protein
MALSTFYNGSNHIDTKTTQINAIAISIILIRHSLEELYPNGKDMAAATY